MNITEVVLPGLPIEPKQVQDTTEGTSGGAEGDMLEEVLSKVNAANFVVKELITDKDSTTNAIFCKHFPEGTVTYCSNHCTKNLHKQLEN